MLRRGEADAVTFFSPFGVSIILRDSWKPRLAQELASAVAFAAIGPTTAAAIRDAGATVAVEAAEATADSLVAALERYFTSCKRQRRRGV